jgi:DNA-binding NarL/FixJ family response regulator
MMIDENEATKGDAEPATPRSDDLEVMRLLADGLTDYEIAHRLGISVITVRRRVQRLCRSLGARSRLQAMALTVSRGFLHPEKARGDSGVGTQRGRTVNYL